MRGGKLLKMCTTLEAKQNLKVSQWQIGSISLNACPLVPMEHCDAEKKLLESIMVRPNMILYAVATSALIRLASKRSKFNIFSLSLYGILKSPFMYFVNRRWTFSIMIMSFKR